MAEILLRPNSETSGKDKSKDDQLLLSTSDVDVENLVKSPVSLSYNNNALLQNPLAGVSKVSE